jgi:hypothetical protein
MPDLATNVLYYGDNLDLLTRCLPDAAVDLHGRLERFSEC